MPDYYDAAKTQNDSTKAALLAAIATQGSQAKASMDQAAAAIQAQKAQAVAAAITEATTRGAPQAVQDQTTATIGSGYDRRLADLASSSASRQASNASQASAAGTYFDEANAALPNLRTRSAMTANTSARQLASQLATQQAAADRQSAADKQNLTTLGMTLEDRKQARDAAAAAAAQAAEDRRTQAQYAQQLHDVQLEIANTNATKAQSAADQQTAKAAAPPKPTNPLTALGGMSGLQAIIAGATDQVGADGGRALLNPNLNSHQVYDRPKSVASVISEAAGISPLLTGGVQAKQTTAAAATQAKADTAAFNKDHPDVVALGKAVGLSNTGVQQMLDSKEYKMAQQLAELYLQQGKGLDDLKVALGQAAELQNKPKTRAAILSIYGGQFHSSGYTPPGFS